MKTAIVTGGCSIIGLAIQAQLYQDDFQPLDWCRCAGVDLKGDLPKPPVSLAAVIHVAEVGLGPFQSLWERTRRELARNGGSFIFLSSVLHLVADNGYCQSKRQQEAALKEMARWDPQVRVNCIRLGHVMGTAAWPDGTALQPEQFLKRFVNPAEVAKAVAFFLACPSATGSILTIDSGILTL